MAQVCASCSNVVWCGDAGSSCSKGVFEGSSCRRGQGLGCLFLVVLSPAAETRYLVVNSLRPNQLLFDFFSTFTSPSGTLPSP